MSEGLLLQGEAVKFTHPHSSSIWAVAYLLILPRAAVKIDPCTQSNNHSTVIIVAHPLGFKCIHTCVYVADTTEQVKSRTHNHVCLLFEDDATSNVRFTQRLPGPPLQYP